VFYRGAKLIQKAGWAVLRGGLTVDRRQHSFLASPVISY
jgi:hypothetical protein